MAQGQMQLCNGIVRTVAHGLRMRAPDGWIDNLTEDAENEKVFVCYTRLVQHGLGHEVWKKVWA